MGPSGCGKTTLLNVLAHRNAAANADVEATIMVNGITPTMSQFRRISSYVEQEDALIGSLTIRETMYFAAALSLPRYEILFIYLSLVTHGYLTVLSTDPNG